MSKAIETPHPNVFVLSTEKAYTRNPTAELRWRGGVLEQRWWVVEFKRNVAVDGFDEWHAVPTIPP